MTKTKRLITYFLLIVLLVSIPITIYVARQRQQTRSKAGETIPECKIYADIALVIDTSLTMNQPLNGSIKKTSAIEAADDFISNLDLNTSDGKYDRVSIVQFNSQSGTRIVQDLTSERSQLTNALNSLITEQYTRIDLGLLKGKEALLKSSPERPKFVVLLSDGGMDMENPPADGNQLPVLQNAANEVKGAGIQVFGVFYGTDDDRRRYNSDIYMQSVVSKSTYYFTSQNSTELTAKFRDINNLITDCECSFDTLVQVRNASTNAVLENRAGYGTVTSRGDVYLFPNSGRLEKPTNVTQLREEDLGVADVALDPMEANYVVDSTFCFNNNASKPNGCPDGFPVGETGRGLVDNPLLSTIQNLKVTCNADYTYGWRVKPALCPLTNIAQIRLENGSVLTNVQGFQTTSTIDGKIANTTPQPIYDSTSKQATNTYHTDTLDQATKNATDVRVSLAQVEGALNYEVVGTFCDNNAQGCPSNAGQKTTTLTGFDFDCNYTYTYGWIVKKKNSPPVCKLDLKDVVTTAGKVTATFDGSGSSDPDGDTLSYRWTFTDGYTAGNFSLISHSTTVDNTKATLVVCDPSNTCSTNLCEQSVRIGADLDPVCRIATRPSPPEGKTPLSIEFDGSGSFDPESKPLTFSWAFTSDNSTSNLAKVTKNVTQVGTWKATLTVTDDKGTKISCEVPYKVETSPVLEPVCRLTTTPSPVTGTSPLNAQFDGASSYDPENKPLSFAWSFSDDPTLKPTTALVSRSFNSAVTGRAVLTITTSGGKTMTCEAPYTITTTPPPSGSHNECTPEYTCESVTGEGDKIKFPPDGNECAGDPECLPKTEAVCLTGACVNIYANDSRIKDCADPADGDYCRCTGKVGQKNICLKPPVVPPTGVNGASLVVTTLIAIISLLGLRLIF